MESLSQGNLRRISSKGFKPLSAKPDKQWTSVTGATDKRWCVADVFGGRSEWASPCAKLEVDVFRLGV